MRAKTVGRIEQAGRANGRKRRGARHTAVQWARIIEAQRHSDRTVVEFCRRRGIAKATFWYWRKRLAIIEKQRGVARRAQSFLAVPLVAPVTERIEVDLGAMRVQLDGSGAARVVDAIVARVETGTQG